MPVSSEMRVSIHAPTGGATSPAALRRMASAFQFTRPRGARHLESVDALVRAVVSIHAPTGGATSLGRRHGAAPQFQFTRPRGARLSLLAGCVYRGAFQFTRPRGARHDNSVLPSQGERFNSRAHGGRDSYDGGGFAAAASFNSRAHGGRDASGGKSGRARPSFNSRAHGGRDPHGGRLQRTDQFQFTRPRGARPPTAWGRAAF